MPTPWKQFDYANWNKKASVVIANYNNAKYIEDCVNSLNSQTYNNVEIIFFDDNSEDNSTEIIKKYHKITQIQVQYWCHFSYNTNEYVQ